MSTIYETIVRPLVTEKSNLALANSVYTFVVVKDATKIDVRNAVQKIYNVKVKKVNTANYEGKEVSRGRVAGKKSDWKKAIVYLVAGQKIDAFHA